MRGFPDKPYREKIISGKMCMQFQFQYDENKF